MKKIFLICSILLIAFNLKAQITLEQTYDSANVIDGNQLYMINLENSGEKYVKIVRYPSNRVIYLYNLDHTLYKTISCNNFPLSIEPTTGDTIYNFTILYISENLFNLDNNIEFMYSTEIANFGAYTGIYDEFGNIIFSVDSGWPGVRGNVPQQQRPIYNTVNGTKMILSFINGQAKVYRLPGTLSTGVYKTNEEYWKNNTNAYPNPSGGSMNIDFVLSSGETNGEIIFYNLQGVELKKFYVNNTMNSFKIDNSELPSGTYLYHLVTPKNSFSSKKIIIIK